MSTRLFVMPPPELDGSLAEKLEAKSRAEIEPGDDFNSFFHGFAKGALLVLRSGSDSNPVVALNRRDKAERFANTLDAWCFTSKQLAAMSTHQWELLAQAIGEQVPSELTVPLICQMIQDREVAREKQRQEKGHA